ncbi:hypothetical protein FRC15_012123, partial [Serendipita sp. 397]
MNVRLPASYKTRAYTFLTSAVHLLPLTALPIPTRLRTIDIRFSKYQTMAIIFAFFTSLLLFRVIIAGARPHVNLEERAACNIQTSSSVSCNNGIVTFGSSLGSLSGLLTSNAIRFTVKYATAARFQPPQMTSLVSS